MTSDLVANFTCFESPRTGEIQKGREDGGRDGKCHKLSQIVVTFYDEFYDVLCQWNKETEIVIKCRKVS